jgi:hypothetical protein
VSGEIDPVRVVDDAIQDGVGVGWITDEYVPFVGGLRGLQNDSGTERRDAIQKVL